MAQRILIGVTGGVAAYKTAALTSELVQAGYEVRVAMTAGARRFVGPATFAALTGHPVAARRFDSAAHPLGAHIELARQADLLCIAPATANFLAQAASGAASDLLSTLYLSFAGPVIVAPAMNCEMWAKPAVQRNVAQLKQDGVRVIEPQEGWLSCRERGRGRMAEPARIRAALDALLQPRPT